jgi:very-short-patch-repair endonuclease
MFTEADIQLASAAREHHGVFTYADALSAGLTVRQTNLRSRGAWVRVHEGVFRMPGAVPTWQGDLRAACLAAGNPSGVTHRSAAAVFELPGRRKDLVEITCRRWKRTITPGLIVHESTRFGDVDIIEVDGIPVSRPERAILELAGLKPYPNYVEAVIHAARRKRLITYESTLATFNRLARRGVPGVKAMRIALERWNPENRASESEMETLLVQVLREGGLPDPVLQYEVTDERGEFVGRVDAAFPQWRVAIEYDSTQEHSDEFQIARDARRRNDIIAAGFRPLTARHVDLKAGGNELVDQIVRIVRSQPA